MTPPGQIAAQRHGNVQSWVKGYDLFLAANSVAWIKGTGVDDESSLTALRRIIENGYRRPKRTESPSSNTTLSEN